MYQIRFYYKNQDKSNPKDIVYHLYGRYETYEKACKEMKWLIDLYKEIQIDEVIFAYSFPKRKIEAYALFLSKRGKDFATIISE